MPFEPNFPSLHRRGLADLWWFMILLVGSVSAAVPAILAHFSVGVSWLTMLIAALSFSWLIIHLAHLGWRERTTVSLDDQELDTRVWAASRSQQIGLGFKKQGSYLNYEMLARRIGEETQNYDGHEFIIRNSKDTVAVANVIRIHDQAYWPLAIYECLELHGTQISLSSIFESSDVRSRIGRAQKAKSDFICVGLTSHRVETVGTRGAESLSKLRAKSLGVALLSFTGLDRRRSKFFAVGLGQSMTFVEEGESDEARNQRSAVILAITRRQDISEILGLEAVTEALIQNYRTARLDLSDYEFSDDISRQLSQNEIDFAGFV